MAEDLAATKIVRERFGDAVLADHARLGEETIVVAREKAAEICRFLKDDPRLAFAMLTDLTVVDQLPREPRFEVVYHLYSIDRNVRIRVKAPVPESDPRINTATAVWAGANWMEREAFDLYGIVFEGHPDPRRILLYPEFVGHPLRKDYPKEKRQPVIGPPAEKSDPELPSGKPAYGEEKRCPSPLGKYTP